MKSLKVSFIEYIFNKRLFITLVFISFTFLFSYSQSHTIKFNNLTIKDGLSQSTVNCILQDKYGFIWAGTQDGLNKFNGYSVEVYKFKLNDSTSLSNSFITSLYEDNTGKLWIGTQENGVLKYDSEHSDFISFKYDPKNENGLTSNRINCFYEDNFGVMWFGTAQGGLNKLDKQQKPFQNYGHNPYDDQSLSSNLITDITEGADGRIWVSFFGNTIGTLYPFNRPR